MSDSTNSEIIEEIEHRNNLRCEFVDELTAKSFSIAMMNLKRRRISEPTSSFGLDRPLFFEVGRIHWLLRFVPLKEL